MRSKPVLLLLLVIHAGVTARAVWEHGYWALFAFAFADWPQFQIFVDLSVALGLLALIAFEDARAHNRRIVPYLVATVFLGSPGLLAYFLVGAFESRTEATQ